MITSRWATLAVAVTVVCTQAVATTSCGNETHDVSGAGDGGGETSSALADAGGDDSTLPDNDSSGDFLQLDSAPPVPDGCTPVLACPSGVQCGRYVDPCSGNV